MPVPKHPDLVALLTRAFEGGLRSGRKFLGVVERADGLIDCRLLGIRCDDFEVRAANSFAPPFAHFFDDLATHEAAKLADEEAIVADGERPVSSTGFDHIP